MVDENVSFGSAEELEKENRQYWAKASFEERSRMITYLRECFYGEVATTGKIEKTYRFIKVKGKGKSLGMSDD
jgi:hypothetical protein